MELTKDGQSVLLDCMLEMGDLLLDAGAEISRVEDTLSRMGRAYGALRTDVFVIPSLISISMEFVEGEATTQTRRIHSNGLTDFYRLEKLNALSRSCCAEPLPTPELRAQLDHVAAGRKPFAVILGGSVLAAFSFAIFFGGSIWDGLASAVFAVAVVLLQERLGRTELNTVAFNLLVSLLIGLGVGVFAAILPVLHMDKILIGDIMLLIPGLAMTNAVRNMLVGNTISGAVRLAESLIWAGALAGGFMVALLVVGAVF
ncbi:MAG: threonine/serine exporter family protein [Oscillospiraceae bacterium]|nr:threonine/serine exporter family protein [Oscillospiraceae bacterium]